MPFVENLYQYINPDVFLETGTYQGDTLYNIANNDVCVPKKIISLELSDVFHKNCSQRFEKDPKVTIYKANSKYDLYGIIQDIETPITFWLDSHWSGIPDVGCDVVTVCPILEELEQIKKHKIKNHTIMIDDIRLMNNNGDRYHGFPITLSEIIIKIMEINPEYKIKFYDDFIEKNDVLVAYIEKICVQCYLTDCKTNSKPPGFADYLRGTITLFYLSKKYGFELLLDNTHPLFKYIKENKRIIKNPLSSEVIELIPPLKYIQIYNTLNDLFQKKESFSLLTNSFYNYHDGYIENWGEMTEECRDFLKDILTPSFELEKRIKYVLENIYNMKENESFHAIHIRKGDHYLHTNEENETIYNFYYKFISEIVENKKEIKYVLLTDYSFLANRLKENIPCLYYWDNKKVHMGDLQNLNESSVLDTLTDFFILSKSSEILFIADPNVDPTVDSGFSKIVSILYKIKYSRINII
jgi:hypothetical protein